MSKLNKHILILTPGFPANEEDYICIPPLQEYLLKLIAVFQTHKISVITVHYPFTCKKYQWNNIPVQSLGGANSVIKKPLLWYKIIQEAKKINKTLPVDVIHSLWLGECAMTGNYLSRKFNSLHCCTLMGQDVKKSNKYLRFSLDRNFNIVALSKNQAKQFFELTGKKVNNLIPWGIDTQPGSNVSRDIDLLSVGSIIPLKNHTLFVEIVEELTKSIPGLKAVLIGTGTDEKMAKQIANDKRVNNNIKFTGQISRHEIFNYMRRSKLLIHTSYFEGSGYVFAEALANGMNIVSYDVGYAEKNHKWSIASDEQDFIMITKDLLSKKLDYTPFNMSPIAETVNKYAELYGLI